MSHSLVRLLDVIGLVGLCLFVASGSGVAQTPVSAGPQSPSLTTVSVVPQQGNNQQVWLLIAPSGTPASAEWFADSSSPGGNIDNYTIYEVTNANSSRVSFKDVSPDFLNSSGQVQIVLDKTRAVLPLKQPLRSDKTYLIEAKDPQGNYLDATISASPTLASSDQKHIRNAMYVNANVPLKATYPANTVTVTYDPGQGPKTIYPARVLGARPSLGLELWIDEPLPAGLSNSLQLKIDGLMDLYGVAVPVSGPLPSAASAPTDATKDFISIQISAIGAVHSGPTYSATGAVAPLHVAQSSVVLPYLIHFDPSITFDVGSKNATTTNAVTIPSQFIRPFLLGRPRPPQNLADLDSRKPSHISILNAMGGLRAEIDTQYGGTNLIGEGRAEFYLSKLYATANARTAAVSAANPSIRSTLNLPANGWSVTPYIQYDGGGHVKAQSISNSTANLPNIDIPTYSISRFYFGSQATATYGINSVTFDGSWVELFNTETAPFKTNSIVYSRTVSGLQPHAKGTYNISLDQAKHFSGSLSWENGRTAPSFQYLNKVTAGILVIY
ncbi:hypothetical protein [Tunturiibacter gelidoferens]|uniref:Uncharacterized protein n=1 Tax=Tunturiibacter lichenicola TaxID=2051959 RepID=A0A7Y9NKU8_9BACT|nr:hypothetical protein [Edaphobacter lichenicola]NYF51082.1 hypothetical protein [Edaphobacter lichenicola]